MVMADLRLTVHSIGELVFLLLCQHAVIGVACRQTHTHRSAFIDRKACSGIVRALWTHVGSRMQLFLRKMHDLNRHVHGISARSIDWLPQFTEEKST